MECEILSQPEFAKSERMLDLVDVLEQRSLASAMPIRQLEDDAINVVIGSENSAGVDARLQHRRRPLRRGRGAVGVVAVLGPTRMRYSRTIPTVRFLSALLSELITQIRPRWGSHPYTHEGYSCQNGRTKNHGS
jgi:heat-inducible transcriptional repressor